MDDFVKIAGELFKLGSKIAVTFTHRVHAAQNNYVASLQDAVNGVVDSPRHPDTDVWQAWAKYSTDWLQRAVLFADTLRQRGNNFVAHERAGKPPVLAFNYEMVVDGRTLNRPVNYALVSIVPPTGVTVDNSKRPFIIIDPRAGHGPGIGGFKNDSQVGVALRAGHPVYFVIFFPHPQPGQTLPDVCDAEAHFIDTVAQRHPKSPKPVLVGNCQGGWATMMLAASRPDLTGAVVINGAPMSYWSGSWQGGEGENPMRYTGGILGGSWPTLLLSDLGNGKFDGAHLVANFENLNPANTLWSKYYHLFSNVDTEPPRFLEFERWWGGFSLMNEAEIRWIVNNLFVGNKLARGEVRAAPHSFIDLKAIRAPIIVFSSAGDNITPPQQALNWIADAYGSTEEIKANGQVIVGLFHEDVGHLGIFVSGKVAKKEHAQIVEVLKCIESLRPGLYVMEIQEAVASDGKAKYEVSIEERRLEDLRRINKLDRRDEKPFEVLAQVSEIGEKMYVLGGRPFVRPFVQEWTASFGRWFHPLRWQRWAMSDVNPWMWPLEPLAAYTKSNRQPAPVENVFRQLERGASEMIIAALNLYRDFRDAATESLFFQWFGPAAIWKSLDVTLAEDTFANENPRNLPLVRDALAAIGTGGYPEALALIGALVGRQARRIPLARLELVEQLVSSDEVLSQLPAAAIRRIKAEQAVVAELEPERGLRSLPELLSDANDRERALAVLDDAVASIELTAEQRKMLVRVREVLGRNDDVPETARSKSISHKATSRVH